MGVGIHHAADRIRRRRRHTGPAEVLGEALDGARSQVEEEGRRTALEGEGRMEGRSCLVGSRCAESVRTGKKSSVRTGKGT